MPTTNKHIVRTVYRYGQGFFITIRKSVVASYPHLRSRPSRVLHRQVIAIARSSHQHVARAVYRYGAVFVLPLLL